MPGKHLYGDSPCPLSGSPGPTGSAEVRPLCCTGAGVSQGDGGYKPKGDLIGCFLIVQWDLPYLCQMLCTTALRCGSVSKADETLKSSPGFQFECVPLQAKGNL